MKFGSTHTTNAVKNHAEDLRRGAWCLQISILVAREGTGMSLHQARITHAVVGGAHTNTAFGFLEKDCEDEAVVDLGQVRDELNSIPYLANFLISVVLPVVGSKIDTSDVHDAFVCIEPGLG